MPVPEDEDRDPCNGDPEDAAPGRRDVEVSRDDLENASADRDEFEREDEIHDMFVSAPLFTPIAADGLPSMSVERADGGAPPPLTYDTLVCVEDARVYVEVWEEELSAAVNGTERLYRGRSRYSLEDGSELVRREFEPAEVAERYGEKVVISDGLAVPVRPTRPGCAHYKRMVWANSGTVPGEPGHLDVHRNCTARRSIGGAFLGLTDQGVYCCEYRDPPDPRSVAAAIEDMDRRKLDGRPHLKLVPAFGVAGEETNVAPEDDVWTIGGIFGRR